MAAIKNEYWECETVGEPIRAEHGEVGKYYLYENILLQCTKAYDKDSVYIKFQSYEGNNFFENFGLFPYREIQPVHLVTFLQKKESEPMATYNQLRANVRNYAVGLTCEEIEKEIGLAPDSERAKYFAEYLKELEKEQGRVTHGTIRWGSFFKKTNSDSVFMKLDEENHSVIILPVEERGTKVYFDMSTKVYRVTDVEITQKER